MIKVDFRCALESHGRSPTEERFVHVTIVTSDSSNSTQLIAVRHLCSLERGNETMGENGNQDESLIQESLLSSQLSLGCVSVRCGREQSALAFLECMDQQVVLQMAPTQP